MTTKEKIDEYINKMTDWRGDYLKQIRELILTACPGIVEEWKWNSPVWSDNGMVCSVGAFKKHVSLTFFKGALLTDKNQLFNSGTDSKNNRSIIYHEGDKINEKALVLLLKEATAANKK